MDENYTHRGTGRIVQILELVSSSENGHTFMELSKLLDVPKSSLFPVLKTLKESDFLVYNELTSRYSLGLKIYELGCNYIKMNNYLDFVKVKLEEVVRICSETCYFGVFNQGEVVYLLNVDSPKEIRMVAAAGKRLLAYSTAVGKALLSRIDNIEQLKGLYPEGLKPLTEKTITSFEELFKQIIEIKNTGFAYEYEESTEHIACVATPIYKDKKIVAALSIATPIFRCDEEKIEFHKELLIKYRNLIEDYISSSNASFE